MPRSVPEWLAPTSIDEALVLQTTYAGDTTVVAGGTFIGILMSQRLIQPSAFLSLRDIHELSFIEQGNTRETTTHAGQVPITNSSKQLCIGAMVTHRELERSALIRADWPALAYTFSQVASPRVRNQATIGGVLADADYASDPPAMLHALNARAVARSKDGGEREITIEELITGYYETSLRPDELLTEVRIPYGVRRSVYRKFRSRSVEDRPCVSVAAAQIEDTFRVVVGAVAERPQYFPDICSLASGKQLDRALAAEIARRYAQAIDPITDSRGSSTYRRRIIAVEVRRTLEELMTISPQEERREADA